MMKRRIAGLTLMLAGGVAVLQGCATPQLKSAAPYWDTRLASTQPAKKDKRPNILLIVADDLGYSDLGAYGGEIDTPHLDRLAARGKQLTQFYASPFCSPTRAMLLSGADHHRAGFGTMAELLTPELRRQPGYEGYLHERVVPFPALLRDAGYRTMMTGKWHLGLTQEQSPANRGFDHSYVMTQGGAGHFDQVGTFTPDPNRTPIAQYRENGASVTLPKDFYSTEFFASKLIDYIDAGRRGPAEDKPFFAYLAFTAPHWPLQAPQALIDKYSGRYDVGYEVIRERRLQRMKELGLVPKDVVAYQGNPAWPRWEQLSPEQRRHDAKRMAVYAAMVESMDQHIGRVLDHLAKTGELDNTVVIFMSDNGADGNTLLDDGANRAWVERSRDNRYANIGRPDSYIEYGPGWGQVSSTPLNQYKAYLYEGGITVPMIARLPAGLSERAGGKPVHAPAHVTDIAPTLLQLAGVEHPGSSYKGREVVPLQGRSMLAHLSGQSDRVHDEFRMGWELLGRRAMRKGDWKIVEANPPWGKGRWELFDLAKDRGETRDLAAQHPDKLRELVAEYERFAKANGIVELPKASQSRGYSHGLDYYKDLERAARPR
jgi:arylsulfatase A-like enzyme